MSHLKLLDSLTTNTTEDICLAEWIWLTNKSVQQIQKLYSRVEDLSVLLCLISIVDTYHQLALQFTEIYTTTKKFVTKSLRGKVVETALLRRSLLIECM